VTESERPEVAQVIMDEERRRMEWERRQVEKAAAKAAEKAAAKAAREGRRDG